MGVDADVVVYSTAGCSFCRAAEALLRRRAIPFQTVDVTANDEARADLVLRAEGRRTVPVIFIRGRVIGGYQELVALERRGELDDLLKLPADTGV